MSRGNTRATVGLVQTRDRDSGISVSRVTRHRVGVHGEMIPVLKKRGGEGRERKIPGIAWRGCDYKNRTNYFYGD